MTGPTGSGKSSTQAAIIDIINEKKHYHVVTIEDPIEYLHSHKNSTINQREVGHDTKDFPSALRATLRQAPKVILIGEMRDFETTEIALEAAETGHLVLSTLHTIDASKTVDRIIGLYPKNEEQVIRTRLAQTFRYIISQRLIPRADRRGRIAAVEILRSSPRTREYIEAGEGDGKSLLDAMRDGKLDGMQDFDTVIKDLIEKGNRLRRHAHHQHGARRHGHARHVRRLLVVHAVVASTPSFRSLIWMPVMFGVGVSIHRFLLRKIIPGGELNTLLYTAGLSLLIANLALLLWTGDYRTLNLPYAIACRCGRSASRCPFHLRSPS